MSEIFHGMITRDLYEGAAPLRDVETSVIGIIGTAEKGQENEPFEVRSMAQVRNLFGAPEPNKTLVRNISAIFKQVQTRPKIIAIRVSESGSSKIEDSWEDLSAPRRAWIPSGVAEEVQGGARLSLPYKGLKSDNEARWVIDVDEDWSRYKSFAIEVKNGVGLRIGIATSAKGETTNQIYRPADISAITGSAVVEDGDSETDDTQTATIDLGASTFQIDGVGGYTNPISNLDEVESIEIALITPSTDPVDGAIEIASLSIKREVTSSGVGDESTSTGAFAFSKSQAKYGYLPTIIIAPQVIGNKADADKLFKVVARLRAVAIIDRPKPASAASAWEKQYSLIPNNSRLKMVYPNVIMVEEGEVGLSALWAGVRIRTDDDRGWEYSASNKGCLGVERLAESVEYIPDEDCEADQLNRNLVTTMVNDGGWKIWGNRTLADGNEAILSFMVARRTKDIIDATIKKNVRDVIDEGIKTRFIAETINRINQQFRIWVSVEQRILGGKAWFDEDKNPPDRLADGQIIWSYDFTTTPVGEKHIFESITTNRYIAEVFANANNS